MIPPGDELFVGARIGPSFTPFSHIAPHVVQAESIGCEGSDGSMDDMTIPDSKKTILAQAQADVETVVEQYQEGLITDGERYNKIVDIWAAATDRMMEPSMSAPLESD